MTEIEILHLASDQYNSNGLFTIAVIIGIFISFRAARFASQNSVLAKVMVSLFAVTIAWFSIVIGSLRDLIDRSTAVRLADAQASGVELTAQSVAAISDAGVAAGDVLTQNYFADVGTLAFTVIFLLIALGSAWLPNTNFSEK